jgi:hypothetical protein
VANELNQSNVESVTKINPSAMQTIRLLQAAVLMLLVAVAASCASSKAYTSKIFAPRVPLPADSTATALRFFESEDPALSTADWVSTDIIMGTVLDQFAKTYPPQAATATAVIKKDSATLVKEDKNPVLVKQTPPEEPAPRAVSMNGTRLKKTRNE